MTERKIVEFYYDFSSPNAYFASVQLPPIAERHGADIVYRPFLLGAVFKVLGTPTAPLMTTPAKAEHTMADMNRWSRRYGVPFSFPSQFPMNTVKALRAAIALEQGGSDTTPFVNATFAAYWVNDEDISSPKVLERILEQSGHDAEAIIEATGTQEVKDALKAATDDALAKKVFGTPTFLVDGDLFFGKDRLDFVEDALVKAPA